MPSKSQKLRAEENFSRAIEALQKTLRTTSSKVWKTIPAVEAENFKKENVDDMVETLIQVRGTTPKTRVEKSKEVAKLWFRASLPFNRLFISILQQGAASVRSLFFR
jgi:hypothetical protein